MWAIKIGKEVCRVFGEINETGWLIWKYTVSNGVDSGVSQPGTFCEWSERQAYFPDCVDVL